MLLLNYFRRLLAYPVPLTIIAFYFLILVTFIFYWPGLDSPFIFDDIPNLSPMGAHENLGFWRDLGLFLLQGDSGPTGRPISLASFYINDSYWFGSSPASFKYTNLMIHILNGILLYWLSLKISSYTSLPQYSKLLLALVATTLWLLHPLQVNTVLYVVQRMTELSTLFTLTGLLFFLKSRETLLDSPKRGWLWLTAGVGLSFIFALLSKENGITLGIYILAIEYSIIRAGSQKPINLHIKIGLFLFGWFPSLALVSYLILIALKNEGYASRSFSLSERLLTQTRVLWDYVYNIIIPNTRSTLFHDDFILSTSLVSPLSTVFAISGLFLVIFLTWKLKPKYPIIGFAVAWFLGGHLLESSTIALELYFEHRNYLPLYGIVFAITYYSLMVYDKNPKFRSVIALGLSLYLVSIFLIGLHTVHRWSSPSELIIGWVEQHPKSQRSLEALDSLIGNSIKEETRLALMEELDSINAKSSNSAHLIFKKLLAQCKNRQLDNTRLLHAMNSLKTTTFTNALPKSFADFASQWMNNQCGAIDPSQMTEFIEHLLALDQLNQADMTHVLHYWQAGVQATQGNLDEVITNLEKALQLKPDLDVVLTKTQYLMSAGLNSEALSTLEQAKTSLCYSIKSCWVIKLREPDIDNMIKIIKANIDKAETNKNEKSLHYSSR